MLRQLLLVAGLAVLTAACSSFFDHAFAPASNPWPIPHEGRVRRDGRLLRVYGASPTSRAEAELDAKIAMEAWMWCLDLGDDIPERKALIGSILTSPEAEPVPSPVPEKSGFTSIIEVDLTALQKKLGTHYD